jgi:hypothetical protein
MGRTGGVLAATGGSGELLLERGERVPGKKGKERKENEQRWRRDQVEWERRGELDDY